MTRKGSPVHLDLLHFKWPWAAIASGLHRISGILLFFLLPISIYLFSLSVRDPHGFMLVHETFQNPLVKIAVFITMWALLHHLISGLRFLLLDADIGIAAGIAQNVARVSMLAAAALALVWSWVLLP
ncbi:MAG: succinate dehydrogenase, cytochrome b556 subunit [Gammaproteobacteria bacterium]|nr:MAG: succinate dehydrogenase, cytochrome b556 subunit [Gammaproteobacteria bacterium]